MEQENHITKFFCGLIEKTLRHGVTVDFIDGFFILKDPKNLFVHLANLNRISYMELYVFDVSMYDGELIVRLASFNTELEDLLEAMQNKVSEVKEE